jgi:hypothetical protein
MRSSRQAWLTWHGERIHSLRLAVESLCAGLALWVTARLFYVFFTRISFPFDLEWCEGGTLYQAYRVIHGFPLYPQGNVTWAPFPYPPVHTAVLALIGLWHLDFWTGRLLSILMFAFMCAVIFRDIYRHAQRSSFGVTAGALAVATIVCGFPVVGQWYDLVRVDTMMLTLMVMGISSVSRREQSPRNIVISALLLTAAVYTKQTAVFLVLWCCLFAIVRDRRFGLRLSGLTLFFCVSLLALLQWTTHGTFWFWTVAGLQNHTLNTGRLLRGLRIVVRFAPFVVVVPLAAGWLAAKRQLSEKSTLWLGSLLAAIPASLLPFAKVGGYLNNLMPLVVFLGPSTALLAIDAAMRAPLPWSIIARWGTVLGLTTYVGTFHLNWKAFVPSSANRRGAEGLNELVRSLEGGVIVPYFAFLPARNGHYNLHWHRMVVLDAQWRRQPMDEISALYQSGARWVLINSRDGGVLETYVRSQFVLSRRLSSLTSVTTHTGAPAGVDELWENPN